MSNRHCSFTITVSAAEVTDGVFSATIEDAEGPQGKQEGAKMTIVGNSLRLIGKGLDEFMADRIENSWSQKPRRSKRR